MITAKEKGSEFFSAFQLSAREKRKKASRANLFGGQVSIHSALNIGTEVKVVFTV